MKNRLFILLITCFFAKNGIAQIGISATNTAPHASSMLDVSSTTKGLLIPRMTTAQRLAIASPANGLTVYDNNTLGFWFFNGSSWQNLLTVSNNLWLANGSNIYNNNLGNIGIGTNMPDAKMHIKSDLSNVIYKAESFNSGLSAGVELKTDGGIYDNFELRKWAPLATGTIAGVPLNGLSLLTTGANTTAGMFIGTIPAQPIYFSTDNKVRMRLLGDGTLRLGPNSTIPNSKFSIVTTGADSISLMVENQVTTGISGNTAIAGTSRSERGIGVQGATFRDLTNSGIEANSYGVLGTSGNYSTGAAPVSVGAYATSGIAIRARSNSGFAIKSTGNIQLEGIEEGANKVLTSDATGNATWQDASASSGWSKDGASNIYNNPNNTVMIGTNTPLTSGSSYNSAVGLQVGKHSLFTGGIGGDPFVRIVNNHTDVPLEAGVALYVSNSFSPAAVFKSAYTGLQVESAASNTFWAAGRFILNNSTSIANAFEISNNGNGYALTVNNIGAGSNASGYFSNSNTTYTANSNIGLELNNSYLKVSGNARTMFEHTTTAMNVTSNQTSISYPGMSPTDMLVVTHVFSGAYIGAVGVWWDAGTWKIFREAGLASPMPVGEKFNVMVVKR